MTIKFIPIANTNNLPANKTFLAVMRSDKDEVKVNIEFDVEARRRGVTFEPIGYWWGSVYYYAAIERVKA